MRGLQVSLRGSAISLAVSGLLVAAVAPWHPRIFDRPVHEVVQGFGAWTLLHATLVAAPVLALFGALGPQAPFRRGDAARVRDFATAADGEPAVFDEQQTSTLAELLNTLTCQARHGGLVRRAVADDQRPTGIGN